MREKARTAEKLLTNLQNSPRRATLGDSARGARVATPFPPFSTPTDSYASGIRDSGSTEKIEAAAPRALRSVTA